MRGFLERERLGSMRGFHMSKILTASCDDQGQVTCEDYIVPEAIVMSEGKQASEGLLLVDKDVVRYIPAKQTSDLITTLEKISAALEQVATGLENLDTQGFVNLVTGQATGSGPGPVATSNISQIRSLKGELDQLKGALK